LILADGSLYSQTGEVNFADREIDPNTGTLYMKWINTADGSLTLQVSFEVGTDLDNANMLTQNLVSQASAKMPILRKSWPEQPE